MLSSLALSLILTQWTTQGIRVLDEGVTKGYATQVNCLGPITCTSNGTIWTINAAGGGAPTDATYVTMSANATLTNEVVVPTCTGSDVLTSNGVAISCTTPGGGGTPGGSDTQVQFNDGGAFGGDAGLTYNKTTDTLTVGTGLTVGGAAMHFTGLGPVWPAIPTISAAGVMEVGKYLDFHSTSADGLDNTARLFVGSGLETSASITASQFYGPVAGTLSCTALTGANCIGNVTNGARFDLGTGTNDYLSSDGTTISTPGSLTATGGFIGNASTATALAADPADCSAGQAATGVDASGNATGCFTPAGTYTLPAASTTLGGVKIAAACAAGNHVSSIGAGGELTCTADSGGGGGGVGTLTRLTATWASSAVANTLGIVGAGGVPMTSPSYAAGAPYSGSCRILMTRPATTNQPRYGIQSSGTVTTANTYAVIGLAGTLPARTEALQSTNALATAGCAAGCTANVITGGAARVFTDTIEINGVMNATGTISLVMAPSAAAAHTAQIGSYCVWY